MECLSTFSLSPPSERGPRQFSGLPLTLSRSVDSRLVRRESTTEGAPFTDGRQTVCCVDSWTCVVSPPFKPRPVRSTISENTSPCARPQSVSAPVDDYEGTERARGGAHHEGREYAEGRVVRDVGAGEVRDEEDERRGGVHGRGLEDRAEDGAVPDKVEPRPGLPVPVFAGVVAVISPQDAPHDQHWGARRGSAGRR